MTYDIRVHPDVLDYLNNLGDKTKKRLKDKIKVLEDRPKLNRSGADIEKIHDANPEAYSLRIGNYRVIYSVNNDTVWVTDIGLHKIYQRSKKSGKK